MVDLSNAADKATERAAARNLERKNLDGEKINSGDGSCETRSRVLFRVSLVAISEIMQKINEHCAAA